MGKYFGTDGVRGRANEGLTLDMSIKNWTIFRLVLWKRKTCENLDW